MFQYTLKLLKLVAEIGLVQKLTRIAGYCANSTECSDHSSKKNTELFSRIGVVVFCMWCWKNLNEKIEFRHIFDKVFFVLF